MGRTLSEHESKRLVAEHGVPVVADRVVDRADDAAAAAAELGLPAVVKLTGPGIAHKTERGLVRLGLAHEQEVEAAARDLLAQARPGDGPVRILVAPMVHGTRELIAGAHRDPQFGPCVMIGIGGVYAEATADVSFGLAPLEVLDALEMLEALRGQTLLDAVRGEPALDRGATAEAIVGLSRLLMAREDVVAVDVNPLVVVAGAPVAVDALVELAEAEA